MNTNLNVFDK